MPTIPRDSAQANSYRKAAERVEDVETLPIGPAKKCPACQFGRIIVDDTGKKKLDAELTSAYQAMAYHITSPILTPRACSPAKRISIGLFSRCRIDGNHLHESCKNCGHEWLSRFAGDQ